METLNYTLSEIELKDFNSIVDFWFSGRRDLAREYYSELSESAKNYFQINTCQHYTIDL